MLNYRGISSYCQFNVLHAKMRMLEISRRKDYLSREMRTALEDRLRDYGEMLQRDQNG